MISLKICFEILPHRSTFSKFICNCVLQLFSPWSPAPWSSPSSASTPALSAAAPARGIWSPSAARPAMESWSSLETSASSSAKTDASLKVEIFDDSYSPFKIWKQMRASQIDFSQNSIYYLFGTKKMNIFLIQILISRRLCRGRAHWLQEMRTWRCKNWTRQLMTKTCLLLESTYTYMHFDSRKLIYFDFLCIK